VGKARSAGRSTAAKTLDREPSRLQRILPVTKKLPTGYLPAPLWIRRERLSCWLAGPVWAFRKIPASLQQSTAARMPARKNIQSLKMATDNEHEPSEPEATIRQLAEDIYIQLGPGHPETTYNGAMEVGLRLRGIEYETKRIVEVKYEGHWCWERRSGFGRRCR
jgi:hypothetical protein